MSKFIKPEGLKNRISTKAYNQRFKKRGIPKLCTIDAYIQQEKATLVFYPSALAKTLLASTFVLWYPLSVIKYGYKDVNRDVASLFFPKKCSGVQYEVIYRKEVDNWRWLTRQIGGLE